MRIPQVNVIPGHISFEGGLDLVSPPSEAYSGSAMISINYVADRMGGYSRIDGYERFSGQPSPSNQKYWYCATSLTGTVSIGDVVTGEISGAQGVVVFVAGDHIDISMVVGTWQIEPFSVGGHEMGVITSLPVENGEPTPELNAMALSNTADIYRSAIQRVPGTGPVRGVVSFKGVVYAFRDSGSNCKMYKSTLSGWVEVTTPTRIAGGRYEFTIYNFTGSTDTVKLFGCDGKNKAFQFDGTTFTELTTGMAKDAPSHIAAWKKHLFLTFKGSLQLSSLGDPTSWTPLTGAAEIGMGDDITGLLVQPGDSLAVFARHSTFHLMGTSSADFEMQTIAQDVGCIEWTAQNLGSAFCLDDRGIVKIKPTNVYGNFAQNTISQQIQTLINDAKGKIVGSTVYKSDDQYRIYCNDGTGIILTLTPKAYYYSTFAYPDVMSCVYSGEDATGSDVTYMGGEDGYVYEARKGSSFDGEEIEAVLKLAYNSFKYPTTQKRFRNGSIEMKSIGCSTISVWPEFSYSNLDISRHEVTRLDGGAIGGFWDSSLWESFRYDSQAFYIPGFAVDGVGLNVGLTFYSKSKTDLGHTLSGATINYTILRVNR